MEDIFFNGIWRMDWGLGNPNKTAALIVELMLAVVGIGIRAEVRILGIRIKVDPALARLLPAGSRNRVRR